MREYATKLKLTRMLGSDVSRRTFRFHPHLDTLLRGVEGNILSPGSPQANSPRFLLATLNASLFLNEPPFPSSPS